MRITLVIDPPDGDQYSKMVRTLAKVAAFGDTLQDESYHADNDLLSRRHHLRSFRFECKVAENLRVWESTNIGDVGPCL